MTVKSSIYSAWTNGTVADTIGRGWEIGVDLGGGVDLGSGLDPRGVLDLVGLAFPRPSVSLKSKKEQKIAVADFGLAVAR